MGRTLDCGYGGRGDGGRGQHYLAQQCPSQSFQLLLGRGEPHGVVSVAFPHGRARLLLTPA